MSDRPPEPIDEARRWYGEAGEELKVAEVLADSAASEVTELVAAARRVVATAAAAADTSPA